MCPLHTCNVFLQNWLGAEPCTCRYGLREALAIVAEEGLENMWARHRKVAQHLWQGLGDLGLEPFVEKPEDRLITVNTIKVQPLPLPAS